jgi:uncharacterized repeat protein (TIGR01451 family)
MCRPAAKIEAFERRIHDMKKRVILGLVTALFFVGAFAAASRVEAAAVEQDGLSMTMTADKSDYSAGDSINVTVTIRNDNPFNVRNVELEYMLPNGLRLAGANTGPLLDIPAGETVTFSAAVDSKGSGGGDDTGRDGTVGGSGCNGGGSLAGLGTLVFIALAVWSRKTR